MAFIKILNSENTSKLLLVPIQRVSKHDCTCQISIDNFADGAVIGSPVRIDVSLNLQAPVNFKIVYDSEAWMVAGQLEGLIQVTYSLILISF